MNVENMIYIEMHVLCLILLATLYAFIQKYMRVRISNSLSGIYALTGLSSVLDIIWILLDGRPEYITLFHVVNILYLCCFSFIGYFWLYYCAKMYPFRIWRNQLERFLYLLPAIVAAILIIVSSHTGWVYYIDNNGTYHRGSLFIVQLLPFGYLLFTTALSLIARTKIDFRVSKKQFGTMAAFSIPPFLIGSLQLILPPGSLTTIQFSITISLMIFLINFLESNITKDSLTGLSNRYELDQVIDRKVKNYRKYDSEDLYVLIGDLDQFKSINDTYGHMEGDRALRITADVLKNIFHGHPAILSRMGGDEFAIVIETNSSELINDFIRRISDELEKASQNEAFTLRLSIGIAKYEPGMSLIKFLEKADMRLYENKKKKK